MTLYGMVWILIDNDDDEEEEGGGGLFEFTLFFIFLFKKNEKIWKVPSSRMGIIAHASLSLTLSCSLSLHSRFKMSSYRV